VARLKAAVLVSGRGSNLQALLDAGRTPDFPVEIALVVSNLPDVPALERAKAAGVATKVIDHRGFADRAAFDQALDTTLRAADVEVVCLAGFMRLLTAGFVEAWRNRLINIHPLAAAVLQGIAHPSPGLGRRGHIAWLHRAFRHPRSR